MGVPCALLRWLDVWLSNGDTEGFLSYGRGKGERRSSSHKRLLYCVKVNRTSLDHLLLGVGADIDQMSHGWSISRRDAAGDGRDCDMASREDGGALADQGFGVCGLGM